MQSKAQSVAEYLAELDGTRRPIISQMRDVILAHLPDGYVEAMNWGMISYEVPLVASGKTYNGKPLMYVALAAQKNHNAIYLCGLNCVPEVKDKFEAACAKDNIKLNMGAACVRFKKIEDLHLPAIKDVIAGVPMEQFIAASKRD